LGHTTTHTLDRRPYVPVEAVLKDLEQVWRNDSQPDCVVFSGSGEPTLHDGLGLMIRAVKRLTKLPVVVFTNGSLLFKPELRQELRAADVVVSSLDVLVPGGYGS